jgi:hypothetical protein
VRSYGWTGDGKMINDFRHKPGICVVTSLYTKKNSDHVENKQMKLCTEISSNVKKRLGRRPRAR